MRKKVINYLTICLLALSGVGTLLAAETPTNTSTSMYSFEAHQKEARARLAEMHKNNARVLSHFDTFTAALNNPEVNLSQSDQERIVQAILFAAEKHKNQTRKNLAQTPYITHPIAVAEQLITVGKVYDTNALIGALLHDTTEDTNTSYDEIRKQFGEEVESLVREVSDDKNLPKEERKRLQVVNAPKKSLGAAQIKLSDKLYNLNDLNHNPPIDWNQERIDQYFFWAEAVIDRLPNANPALKKAVEDKISEHWTAVNKKK